jgi:hypothetical protein
MWRELLAHENRLRSLIDVESNTHHRPFVSADIVMKSHQCDATMALLAKKCMYAI